MKSCARRMLGRLTSVALVSAGVACGGGAPPQAQPDMAMVEPSPSPRPLFLERKRISSFGRLEIAYTTEPSPVPLNETFRLLIEINQAGAASRPADVELASVAAEMPDHRHGMNVVPAPRRIAPGRFEVDGMLLHMVGRWTLRIDVVQQGLTERAEFDIVLR